MSAMEKPFVIALEEHYWDREMVEAWGPNRGAQPEEQLFDLDAGRIRDMDSAGIDVQVLSMASPSTQVFDAERATALARAANDRLNETIQRHPTRYAGFAALPTADPAAAADELERTVTQYGFKGAMVHGLSHGQKFLDLKEFWPIYERAQALDVPIYMHPALPHRAVVDAYLKDYLQEFPVIIHAGWGFTIETATQGLRMVLSGVFEAYPDLKIILGHLGEGLPFLLWRLNHAFSRSGNRKIAVQELFRGHFHITTSGNFSDPALLCSLMEMGADRILFSVDYPYVQNYEGTDWMKTVSLSTEDLEKIYNGNARRLLKM